MSKDIFFLTDMNRIGGAEKRLIKTACWLDKQGGEFNIFVVSNNQFINQVHVDSYLKKIIDSSNIKIIDIKNFKGRKITWFVNKIIIKILQIFQGKEFNYSGRVEWKIFFKSISKNAVVHCFIGTASLIEAIKNNQKKGNKTIIEVTSNRVMKHLFSHIDYAISTCADEFNNLSFISVTSTVNKTLHKEFPEHLINRKDISYLTYKKPFINYSEKLIISEKENIIVFSHQFIEAKNPLLFCKAIIKIIDKGILDTWKVKIFGFGPLEQKIRDVMKEYNDIVEIGYTNKLEEVFSKSKIFVSLIETGNIPSNSLFESMRYGVIPVLSDTGITKEFFNNSDILYCDLTINSLVENISKAIEIANDKNLFYKKSKEIKQILGLIQKEDLYTKQLIQLYEK